MKKLIFAISAALFLAGCGDGSSGGGPDVTRVADLPEGAYRITARMDKTLQGTVSFHSSGSQFFEGYYAHGVSVFPSVPSVAHVKYANKIGFINTNYATAENSIIIDNSSKLPINSDISVSGAPGKYDCYASGGIYKCMTDVSELHLAPVGSSVSLPAIFGNYTPAFDNSTIPGTYAGTLSSHSSKCGIANALYMRSTSVEYIYVYATECSPASAGAQFGVSSLSLDLGGLFSRSAVTGVPGAYDISFTYKGETYTGRFNKVADGTYIR